MDRNISSLNELSQRRMESLQHLADFAFRGFEDVYKHLDAVNRSCIENAHKAFAIASAPNGPEKTSEWPALAGQVMQEVAELNRKYLKTTQDYGMELTQLLGSQLPSMPALFRDGLQHAAEMVEVVVATAKNGAGASPKAASAKATETKPAKARA